ncbi:MAG: ABC transporter permease, partial [Marinoscillum sp.]
ESEIPEIANATSIQQVSLVIKDNDQIVNEEHVFAADTGFFKVFGFPVLAGRSEDFFKDPGGIVLAEGVAQKYFGTAVEAMGETLEVGFTGAFRVMKVVGVVACPSNSHIQFDFLVPFQPVIANSFNPPAYESFTTHFVYTYVHIPGNFNPQELTLKFKNFLHRHGDEALKSRFTTSFQPLSEIYLDSTQEFDFTPRGSRTNVEILWIVAWLVLLIATVNFVNLTTAQSMKKVREVGLQKVFGSNRSQLVGRFLAESILLCLMACVLAFVLMGAMLPLINKISGINFLLWEVVRVKLVLVGMSISLIVGIIGGVYPAFLVSSINSYQALRTNDHPKSIGFLTRKVLIVLQFVISMLLIVSTLVISEQLQFMKSKDLGIASEQVLLIKDRAAVANNREKILLLRNALKSDEIRSVTTTSTYPGVQFWSVGFIPAGHEEAVSYPCIFTDHEFALTYDIPIVQGRDLDVRMASDSLGFLINETARNQFGAFDSTWLQQPIGKNIKSTYLQMDGPVIGVMKDFHFMSPHEAIKPLIVMVYPRLKSATQIRIQSNDLGATLQRIESVWTRLNPTVPFE